MADCQSGQFGGGVDLQLVFYLRTVVGYRFVSYGKASSYLIDVQTLREQAEYFKFPGGQAGKRSDFTTRLLERQVLHHPVIDI